MATIFNDENLEFRVKDAPLTDYVWHTSQNLAEAVGSQQMYFDIRMLDPSRYSYPYHSHRNAEEMVVVMMGSMMMRTPDGFGEVKEGDVVFFEKGGSGAHQFYNHKCEPCKYLDIRIKTDIDVCDYPDTGKVNILPYKEIYHNNQSVKYFDGEENVADKWTDYNKDK